MQMLSCAVEVACERDRTLFALLPTKVSRQNCCNMLCEEYELCIHQETVQHVVTVVASQHCEGWPYVVGTDTNTTLFYEPASTPGTCNSYLPNDSTFNRFLWMVNFLARNGFYVVIENHVNMDPTAVIDPMLGLKGAHMPVTPPTDMLAPGHPRTESLRSAAILTLCRCINTGQRHDAPSRRLGANHACHCPGPCQCQVHHVRHPERARQPQHYLGDAWRPRLDRLGARHDGSGTSCPSLLPRTVAPAHGNSAAPIAQLLRMSLTFVVVKGYRTIRRLSTSSKGALSSTSRPTGQMVCAALLRCSPGCPQIGTSVVGYVCPMPSLYAGLQGSARPRAV